MRKVFKGSTPNRSKAKLWTFVCLCFLVRFVNLLISRSNVIPIPQLIESPATESSTQVSTTVSPLLKSTHESSHQRGRQDIGPQNNPPTLPTIILAGVKKSGTTDLGLYMQENGVCPPKQFDDEVNNDMYRKEVHFFDMPGRFVQGYEFYKKRFEHCEEGQHSLDATPNYFTMPERVYEVYKNAGELDNLKLIFAFREPVDRELAAYNEMAKGYLKNPNLPWFQDARDGDGGIVSFDQYVQYVLIPKLQDTSWPVLGDYEKYLSMWFDLFDRQNILILSHKEMKSNSKATELRIQKFLKVEFSDSKSLELRPLPGYDDKVSTPSCAAQNAVADFFRPLNENFYALMNDHPGPTMEIRPFPSFDLAQCIDDPLAAEQFSTSAGRVGTLPNIIVAGAQKAGTTAISDWLFSKGVCRPERIGIEEADVEYLRKEVHFFDHDDRYEQGLSFYRKRYENCRYKLSMDATPNYFTLADRIHKVYSEANEVDNVKIIVSLREPTSRDLSWYNHMVERPDGPDSAEVLKYPGATDVIGFDRYIEDVLMPKLTSEIAPEPILSFYAEYISKWFQYFDPKQILILNYQEVKEDPEMVLVRVQEFVGQKFPGRGLMKHNAPEGPNKVSAPNCDTLKKLSDVFEPYNEKLYEIMESSERPEMQQYPFAQFKPGKCMNADGLLQTSPEGEVIVSESFPVPMLELESDLEPTPEPDLEPMPESDAGYCSYRPECDGNDGGSEWCNGNKERCEGACDGKYCVESISKASKESSASGVPEQNSGVTDIPKNNSAEQVIEQNSHIETTPSSHVEPNPTVVEDPQPGSVIVNPPDAVNKRTTTIPNVLIAGPHSTATQSISSWLATQGVCSCVKYVGETDRNANFYDDSSNLKEGLDFYKQTFDHCLSRLVMDVTPSTFLFPTRVYSTYRQAGELYKLRIILTLREPIDREVSRYNHMVKHPEEASSKIVQKNQPVSESGTEFEIKTESEPDLIGFDEYVDTVLIPDLKSTSIHSSNYWKVLETWFELFDRKQILMISYDELLSDPDKVQWRISKFLEEELGRSPFPHENTKDSANMVVTPSCDKQKILNAIFEPQNSVLYDLLRNNPGPYMEEKPFPPFNLGSCTS